MKPGPPKKPTALKLIEGTYRPDRAPVNEPRPQPAIPPCPGHLSKEAKKEWRRVARELYRLGLLTALDRFALAAYCEFWADFVDATLRSRGADERDLKVIKTGEKVRYDKDGNVLDKSGGNLIENPYFTIKKRTAELAMKFAAEFGMGPACRTRIEALEQSTHSEDPAEKYFKRPG